MERRYKKIVGVSLIILLFFTTVGYSIASESSKESNQDMEKVKILVKNEDAVVDWVSVNEAILKLGTSKDENAEKTLIQLLRRDKSIILTTDSPLPNVMPPLEMLKASSIISLEKMESKKSIPEIERIYQSTEHQVLRDIAFEALKNLKKG